MKKILYCILFCITHLYSFTQSADEYYNKGIEYYDNNEYQEAIKYFSMSIDLDPNNCNSYYYRGISKKTIKYYGGAMSDLTKSIDLMNKEVYKDFDEFGLITYSILYNDAHIHRGEIKFDLNDYYGAISDFNSVLTVWGKYDNENYLIALGMRGLCKLRLKNYKGAIEDYNKYIAIDGQEKRSYLNRGIAKEKLGDKIGACSDYRRAGELGLEEVYTKIAKLCN